MGDILYCPEPKHFCEPPMEKAWLKSPLPNNSIEPFDAVPPMGTVWRCDCGRLWEVVKQPYRNVFPDRKWAKAGLFTSLRWRRHDNK